MEITCPCYTIKVWRVISNEFAKCFADAKTWELLWSRRISVCKNSLIPFGELMTLIFLE